MDFRRRAVIVAVVTALMVCPTVCKADHLRGRTWWKCQVVRPQLRDRLPNGYDYHVWFRVPKGKFAYIQYNSRSAPMRGWVLVDVRTYSKTEDVVFVVAGSQARGKANPPFNNSKSAREFAESIIAVYYVR